MVYSFIQDPMPAGCIFLSPPSPWLYQPYKTYPVALVLILLCSCDISIASLKALKSCLLSLAMYPIFLRQVSKKNFFHRFFSKKLFETFCFGPGNDSLNVMRPGVPLPTRKPHKYKNLGIGSFVTLDPHEY